MGRQGKLLQTASQQNLLLSCLLQSKTHTYYQDRSGGRFRCFYRNRFSVGVFESKPSDPAGGVLSPGQWGSSVTRTAQQSARPAAGGGEVMAGHFFVSIIPHLTLQTVSRRFSPPADPLHPNIRLICLAIRSIQASCLPHQFQAAGRGEPACSVCVCVCGSVQGSA